MKKRNISHWIKNEHFEGVMLFVQALEECVFDYSYESYKLPALNSHYLCYDIVRTASDIDRKVLMDGNFYPLAEEFEQMLSEDEFVKEYVNKNGAILYSKDKNGDYYDLSLCDFKSKIRNYSEIARYLIDFCEKNTLYLSYMTKVLLNNIFCDTYSQDKRSLIYSTTRILITEFVNGGYSKEYIYSTIEEFFYNQTKPIECKGETIITFLNRFTFKNKTHQVIFGINAKAARFFDRLKNIVVRDATPSEQHRLNLQKITDRVVVIQSKSKDVYSAFDAAVKYIDIFLSFHRINQHDSKLFITPKAIVCIEKEDGSLDKGIVIRTAINPLKKRGNTSDLHALLEDVILSDKIKLPQSFYRAMSLHSGAIDSKDVSNQLLNLWTVIEILIDTKRDSEDKINTICTVLGAVLNRCYMYSNIEQLLHDIRVCAKCEIDDLLNEIGAEKNELGKVEKLAILLAVDDYKYLLNELLDSLEDAPLLVYRITHFSESVLRDSQSIYYYLKRHEKRVKWHIMRIYRNRNMIVHNGSFMPYRDIIIENLHYYVDVLIDTLIEYYNNDIISNSSIYKHLLNNQASYQVALGTPFNKKEKNRSIAITSDNAMELIFNKYSGNPIKRVVDDVIKRDELKKKPTQEKEANDRAEDFVFV